MINADWLSALSNNHYLENHSQVTNRENFCTNAWNSDVGPFCPLLMPGTDGKGVWWAECSTPSCEEMYDITKRRNSCLISSVASATDDIKSFMYDGWHEDYLNWEHNSEQCYLANHHDGKERVLNTYFNFPGIFLEMP